MGNCQAVDTETVLIQHADSNRVDRIYWSVSAHEIMNLNPGYYVALLITSPTARSENREPVKQLKLLCPDDTLHVGHVYRLIGFEDVLKEFAAKKCVKLGKLDNQRGIVGAEKKKDGGLCPSPKNKVDQCGSVKVEQATQRLESDRSNGGINRGLGRPCGSAARAVQWKPTLKTIAEVGS
ncbi:hypothetical protein Nepgr_027042 [Nepenthes gracilis]|uniref:Uncharacterized protein n=1 Tax=Nepenthes gracilis TaxID=150966 RepID=A0AAD3Y2Q6_NEPGR|nr:hypothetical protein Nepgr_027042 [Nepenthes gracilis]